jgi:hypothetical protein
VSAILSNQHQKTASTKNESPFLVSVGTIDRHHKKPRYYRKSFFY